MVIVGLGSEEAKIPMSIAACKELDIMGSFRYCNTVSPAACALQAWRSNMRLSVVFVSRVQMVWLSSRCSLGQSTGAAAWQASIVWLAR